MNDLEKLLVSGLRSIYEAEQQLSKAYGEMEKSAIAGEVKRAFGEAAKRTELQHKRLEEVFDALGHTPARKACHGMRGLITEGQLLADELEGHSGIDAALIAVSEKAQHFKIAAYGTLGTWAAELKQRRPADLLSHSLGETKNACAEFMSLAEAAQKEEIKDQHELERLFVRQLRQMFDGEHLLAHTLAEVEFYAVSRILKIAVQFHRWQTKKHVERLEQIFMEIGETADRRPCDGIEGLIDDAQVDVMEFLGNTALDAALIADAQKIEFYEIAAYENLSRWAKQLENKKALSLLQKTLREEQATDKKLSLVAELLRNRSARRHDSGKRRQETAELLKVATHGE
jgi:ferritin-like metal-binding protein YciE